MTQPTPTPINSDPYDSTQSTREHIGRVAGLLFQASNNLDTRGRVHDASKLASPEKELFDRWTPLLGGLRYGSPEYQAALGELKPALDHHYAHNSHHPEHYPDGVAGMSLLDLIEMMCDWKAAGERHADGGDILRSIEINTTRFKLDPQLAAILRNTAKEMGWVKAEGKAP